jgi:hypothetical protein
LLSRIPAYPIKEVRTTKAAATVETVTVSNPGDAEMRLYSLTSSVWLPTRMTSDW